MNKKLKILFLTLGLIWKSSNEIEAQFVQYIPFADSVEVSRSFGKTPTKNETVPLYTEEPVKIMVLLIAIPGHPNFDNEWPLISNHEDYPNENFPLLGTFPDGTLLRDYVSEEKNGPIPVEDWYGPQLTSYFDINSNGKFKVEVVFPKTADGKVFTTDRTYNEWANINDGDPNGMVMSNNIWIKMLREVAEKIYLTDAQPFGDIKLINVQFLVNSNEYSSGPYSAFSPDAKTEIKLPSNNKTVYDEYITTMYNLTSLLHETFHRIGSLVEEPEGFEGLPDRTTVPLIDSPTNMTWGHDIMYNKGHYPSENSLYASPPMLTLDRIFFEWIEPNEVITILNANKRTVKLKDVNLPVTQAEASQNIYRAAKVMIEESYYNNYDEYFLLEYRAGTYYDRNFYNIYETEPHEGILIWHIREKTQMLNRKRSNDHHIDLEVAVPYNGWNGNPIPVDGFPRNYYRPNNWLDEKNAAGDFDYLNDSSAPPNLPDGGMHRWELTDKTHPEWAPYYVRRNTLKSNFFTDEPVRGIVTNKISTDTRPSTKNWDGYPTDIVIYNIKHDGDYMTFDVRFDGGVVDIDNEAQIIDYKLMNNYPNPFNPSTNIEYSIKDDGYVRLEIFDPLGNKVRTLVDEYQLAGNQTVTFTATNLPSGVYFYRIAIHSDKLTAGSFTQSKKMTLIK